MAGNVFDLQATVTIDTAQAMSALDELERKARDVGDAIGGTPGTYTTGTNTGNGAGNGKGTGSGRGNTNATPSTGTQTPTQAPSSEPQALPQGASSGRPKDANGNEVAPGAGGYRFNPATGQYEPMQAPTVDQQHPIQTSAPVGTQTNTGATEQQPIGYLGGDGKIYATEGEARSAKSDSGDDSGGFFDNLKGLGMAAIPALAAGMLTIAPALIAGVAREQHPEWANRDVSNVAYVGSAEYTDEDLAALNAWINASNKQRELEASFGEADFDEAAYIQATDDIQRYSSVITDTDLGQRYWKYVSQTQNTSGELPKLEDMFPDGIPVSVEPKVEDGAAKDISDQVGVVQIIAEVIPDLSAIGAEYLGALLLEKMGKHATGIDYVQVTNGYGYPAILHEGEAVLNKASAEQWRHGQGGSYSGDSIAMAIENGISSMGVYMDGEKLANMTNTKMNRAINRSNAYRLRGMGG